jgi:hypothetical protein
MRNIKASTPHSTPQLSELRKRPVTVDPKIIKSSISSRLSTSAINDSATTSNTGKINLMDKKGPFPSLDSIKKRLISENNLKKFKKNEKVILPPLNDDNSIKK